MWVCFEAFGCCLIVLRLGCLWVMVKFCCKVLFAVRFGGLPGRVALRWFILAFYCVRLLLWVFCCFSVLCAVDYLWLW